MLENGYIWIICLICFKDGKTVALKIAYSKKFDK